LNFKASFDGDANGSGAVKHGRTVYVCDFDGTVATEDVGNRFFGTFARDRAAWDAIILDWVEGRSGGREVLARECALIDVDAPRFEAFLEARRLDPAFAPFVAAARGAGSDVVVASDGLLLYIRPLLARHGLAHVTARSNDARPLDDGRLEPVFGTPAGDGCGRCGTCKGAVIDTLRPRFARVVFAGDGLSDRCAAPRADRVYAKDDLLAFCRETGIAARPFTSFVDVAAAEGLELGERESMR
jgi:2,3-diketo-5-methylthio-1-phosphopentane phosphatase